MNRIPAWVLAGWAAAAAAGCASTPPEIRLQGGVVPAAWVDGAEAGQAEACLSLAKKLWDRDVLEALRYLRRGAQLRSAECCRQYLSSAESESVNLSQRVYARLFLEGVLRKGPVEADAGEDIRGDLYVQLGWAWRHTEPVNLFKAKQVLETMLDNGLEPSSTSAAFVTQLMREVGLRAKARKVRQEISMYAGEVADDSRPWLRLMPAVDPPRAAGWSVAEAGAWGGGSDRLLQATSVLVFLVNAKGEPSFRGDRLWICNLGASPVYLTSLAVGRANHELLPGREEIIPLATAGLKKAELTTGIPLTIRYRRIVS